MRTTFPHFVVSNNLNRLARLLHNKDHHAGIGVGRFHIWITLPLQSNGVLRREDFVLFHGVKKEWETLMRIWTRTTIVSDGKFKLVVNTHRSIF